MTSAPPMDSTHITDALEEALRTLEREQVTLATELAAARAARTQAESLLSVLAEWSFFVEGAGQDRMRLLREAPRLLVPRLADGAAIEVAAMGPRPWAVAHVDPARAASLESGAARLRGEGSNAVHRVPLMDGGRALGWLTVWWERPQEVPPATTMILSLLSQQMAAVLAEVERSTSRRQQRLGAGAMGTMIGHELANPIQALTLTIGAIVAARAKGQADDEWLDQRLQTLRRATRRTERGLQLVLAGEAVRDQRLAVGSDAFDLAEVVWRLAGEVTEDLDPNASPCVVTETQPIPGSWDRSAVEMVLGSLMRHASRAASGAQVDVRVFVDGGARVAIIDRGPPLAPEVGSEFFEPAPAPSGDRRTEAEVASLWVVRELVAAMGGTIGVSTGLEGGATFLVELPLRN